VANWFTRLFRSEQRDEPEHEPEQRAVSFQDVWGSGADLSPMRASSVDTALTLVPVFAATRLLADGVASLPLQTFRQAGDVRTRIEDAPLLRDPSQQGTGYDWLHRAMTSLTLRGNAFGFITQFDAEMHARQLEWLHPDEVAVGDNRATSRPRWFWRGRPIDPDRMLHVAGYTLPGQVLGLSPIAAYALTIETGLLSQQFGRDWFRNGSVPSSVLQTEHQVNEDQATVMKERFRRATSSREPVVLGAGVEYKPISVPPNESQFLATMKATVNQIAAIYGIPPEMIGGESGSSMTYANVEQQAINFVTYTLRPYLVKLETALSTLLPRPQYVRFNVDGIVRADLKTRYEAHHIALKDGWKSKDEVRALEDLPPLPDGQGAGYAVTAPEPVTVPREWQRELTGEERGHH
jgi:HK97 family phage portal protein